MADTETPGLCENCVAGFVYEGEPTGTEQKIALYDMVYVAKPPGATGPTSAIILFTDIFGLGLVNSKLIADRWAKETGFTVYVPDVFYGDFVPANALKMPETAEEARASENFFSKLRKMGILLPYLPWVFRHRPGRKIANAKQLAQTLKNTEYRHVKIGIVGLCYGAAIASSLNAAGLADCMFLAHPSMIGKKDIDALVGPTSFAIAEVDHGFSEEMIRYTETTLKSRQIEYEMAVYPGTSHGFFSRGNLKIEDVRKGFEGGMEQGAKFFKLYL